MAQGRTVLSGVATARSRGRSGSGCFYRSMPLPTAVTPEQMRASLKDGVLEVAVPWPAEARAEPHQVPVT